MNGKSIQQTRSQFDAHPLFHEDAIAHELQVYENRKKAVELQKKMEVARERKEGSQLIEKLKVAERQGVRVPEEASLARYRAEIQPHRFDAQPTSHVPPPVPRPWSVEKLLSLSADVGKAVYQGSPRGGHAMSRAAEGERQFTSLSKALPDDPYWQGVEADRERRKQWRKSNQSNFKHGAEETDDEHDYKFNAAYYATQGAIQNKQVQPRAIARPAQLTDASSVRVYDRDELVALNGEDSDRGSSIFEYDSNPGTPTRSQKVANAREIPSSLMEAHMERAAARKLLQESRLHALGVRAPNARVEMGTQANINANGEEELSTILGIGAKKVGFSPNRQRFEGESQNDLSRHVSSQLADPHAQLMPSLVPEGFVLEPQLPIRKSKQFEPGTSMNTDTVWQRVLNDEKHLASKENHLLECTNDVHKAAPYGVKLAPTSNGLEKVPTVPSSWLNIVQSSANTEGFRPSSMNTNAQTSNKNVGGSWPAESASQPGLDSLPSKESILHRIDQIQLANEEMLIRNRVIRDPLPSSAGGAFGLSQAGIVQDPSERLAREAVAHVASAYRDEGAHEAALGKFRPIGGYGSVTEHGFNALSSQQEADRWAAARRQNESKHMLSTEAQPIRSWATNLPTNFVGSLVDNGPQISINKPNRNKSTHQENAARRKWGDVTFSAPNQHAIAPGVVESLSQKARMAMFPDAAF